MAGIGFQLHKIAVEGSYFQAARAYISSGIISAGPWLSAVVSLTLLSSSSIAFLDSADRALLMATITYVFCASLILVGGPQMVVTRYLADRFYVRDISGIAPACTGVLLVAVPLFSICALPFLLFAPFPVAYRLLVVTLFLAVTLIWLIMIFVSAARHYRTVVAAFVLGYTFSLGGALWLGQRHGVLGSVGGFTLGQVVCLVLLIAHVYLEFAPAKGISFAFLNHARKFWDLALIGILYNAGIWVDNIIYWFSGDSVLVGNFYRTFPAYDAAKLWPYLTTVPAAAVFLVNIETNFYLHYRAFYRHIMEKGTLAEISRAKDGMLAAMRGGLITTLKIQGIVGVFALLLASDLAILLGLPQSQVPMLRVGILAASTQFLVLVTILLLLYLDERKPTLVVATVFAATNAGATLAMVKLDIHLYGIGYLLATIVAGWLGLVYARDRMGKLEYLTFMLQPMGAPTNKERHRLVTCLIPVARNVWSGTRSLGNMTMSLVLAVRHRTERSRSDPASQERDDADESS